MVSNFLLLPFLVAYLSGAQLGLWYVYIAIGNLVVLFDFGFNPTFARNFAFCWSGASELSREDCVVAKGDKVNSDLLAHLMAACRMVYLRISIVAVVALAIPGTLYVLSVSKSLQATEVLVSWFVFSIGTVVNLYYLYYSAMLRGIGAIAADNKIKVVTRILQITISFLFLFLGWGIVGATIGYLVYVGSYRVLSSRAFWGNAKVKELHLDRVSIENERKEEIYSIISFNAYRDGLVQVANYASTQASSLLCSSFLGLNEAGAYSIALQFATAIGNVSLARMNSSRPMLQSAYQRGDEQAVRLTLGRCSVSYLLLFSVLFFGVLIMAYPILNIFKPDSHFSPVVFTGVSIYMLVFDWCALFASMLSNMNTLPYVRAYVISAVAGIVLSVALLLVTNMGVWALVLGPLVVQTSYNGWKWPLYASRALGTNEYELLSSGFRNLKDNAVQKIRGDKGGIPKV